MASYCIDTPGLSNPWETLPEDIYGALWEKVKMAIEDGKLCCNGEIFEELKSISGSLGECLQACAETMILEIGKGDWPWEDYLSHIDRMQKSYESWISEYNGDRKSTVGLNDISIVALAKTLGLPLISMEKANVYQSSTKKRRIPDVCAVESVQHLDFNDFLRAEGIKV